MNLQSTRSVLRNLPRKTVIAMAVVAATALCGVTALAAVATARTASAQTAPQSSLTFIKEVRKRGETAWQKEVTAKPGEVVEWLLTTDTSANADNVTARDVLPGQLQLVAGSVTLIDAGRNAVQADQPLFGTGLNAGNYGPKSGMYVSFATTVQNNFEACEVKAVNTAFVKADQVAEQQNTASVVIKKDNCTTPPANQPTPKYTCDTLEVTKTGDRAYQFKVKATAENATLKGYSYDFGDQTPAGTTDKAAAVTHTYAKDGDFKARATLTFSVQGQDKTATSETCVAVVKVAAPVAPPATPATPATPTTGTPGTLPATGPGGLIAIFTATSIGGAMAYRVYMQRRYNA